MNDMTKIPTPAAPGADEAGANPPKARRRLPRLGPRPLPPRVAAKPDPSQWSDWDAISLPEAAALFFPSGLLKVSSLRGAAKKGVLAVSIVQGKFFTTPAAMRAMMTPTPHGARNVPVAPKAPAASAPPTAPADPPEPLRARASRRMTLEEALKRSAIQR